MVSQESPSLTKGLSQEPGKFMQQFGENFWQKARKWPAAEANEMFGARISVSDMSIIRPIILKRLWENVPYQPLSSLRVLLDDLNHRF